MNDLRSVCIAAEELRIRAQEAQIVLSSYLRPTDPVIDALKQAIGNMNETLNTIRAIEVLMVVSDNGHK